MNPYQRQVQATGTTSTAAYTLTLSDRDKVMAVFANPGQYGPEVRDAVRVLVAAGRSTADPLTKWRPDTAGLSNQFQHLIDLVDDTLKAESASAAVDYVHPDVPQYVPSDWANALNVRAVENTELRLPWLKDL